MFIIKEFLNKSKNKDNFNANMNVIVSLTK